MFKFQTNSKFLHEDDPAWRGIFREALDDMPEPYHYLHFYAPDSQLLLPLGETYFSLDPNTPLHDQNINVAQLGRIANDLAILGKLSPRNQVNPFIDEAFYDSDYAQDTANVLRVLKQAADANLRVEGLTGNALQPFVVNGLVGVGGLSVLGQRRQREQRGSDYVAQETARLIQSISAGQPTFTIYGKRKPGEPDQLLTFNTSDLSDPSVSLDKLRELDRSAADVRRKSKASTHEYKTIREGETKDARDPHVVRTELDAEVRIKDDSGRRFEYVDPSTSRPTGGQMDRSVPVTTNENDKVFIVPESDPPRFYTSKELMSLSNTNLALFKLMMRTNNALLTQLLNTR